MLRKLASLPIVGFLALIPAAADAQTGEFVISQNGSAVGTATFNVKSTPKGYDSTSLVRISMQGLNYELSKTEKLDPANHLVHVVLSGIVNSSAVNIVGRPDDGQILLNVSANGRASTSSLAGHPSAVVLADFDPGALETLLVLASQQNNRDLWAIIPKGVASIVPVQLATYADQQGTWDNQPITVHHLVAKVGDASIDLFAGQENQLLQAELPEPGFAIVRKGFVLTPAAKPGAPPPAPAAQPDPGQPPAAQMQ